MKEKRWKKGRKRELVWEVREKWEAEGRKEKKEKGRNWYDKPLRKDWRKEKEVKKKRKSNKETNRKVIVKWRGRSQKLIHR